MIKRFCDLKPGDKVYYIHKQGNVEISEVKNEDKDDALTFNLSPIIGEKTFLSFGYPDNFIKAKYIGAIYTIYTSESEFLKDLSKYENI